MARQEDWQDEVRDGMRSEGWSVTGPTRIVKVVPRAGPLGTALKGFVCLEKVLVGKTPPEIERALGLPPGCFGSGCRVYRLTRLPMASEVEYELTARFPDGQAFNPAMHDPRYAPGANSIHQWKLLSDIPAQHLLDLDPATRYPYQHS